MRLRLVALNASYPHVNLAVRLLAARCEGAHVYESHVNQPFQRLLRDIASGEPRAIGFSTYIWNAELVLRLCRALRVALPNAILFLGGPEAAHRARELLDSEPSVDYVLRGEGETALPALLDATEGSDCGRVPGLAWRKDGSVVENPLPPPLAPDAWPDAYPDGARGLEKRILYLETARGCPYRCGYCLSAGERVRALPAEEAIRRLTRLAEGGARLVKLVDRTFNFDKARANAIWAALIEHARRTGVRITYHFEIGAQLIDEEAIRVLSRAPKGLFQFEAGIQTTNADALRAVGRRVPFADVAGGVRALIACQNAHVHVDLIAGLPGESLASFARSFDDAYALGAQMLQLGFLKLLHGSGLRARANELGVAFQPDPPYEVLSTRDISFCELGVLKDVERALDWYGNSGRYALSMRALVCGRSPFEVYRELAAALRRDGAFDAELGEKARAERLLRLGGANPSLLTHDFLRRGLRGDLPDALAFSETDEQRALLRARFRPVRGQSVRVLDCDAPLFEATGELIERKTRVLYDPARDFFEEV